MNTFSSSSAEMDTESQAPHWVDSKVANLWIDGFVRFTYWLSKILFWPFGQSTRIDLKATDIDPTKRYVLAANHQSVLDPFLVTCHIPLGVLRHIRTLRYFLANYIFNKPVIRPFAVSLGCFPAKVHTSYPYGLAHAIKQLNNKRSILIFPEGQRAIRGAARTHRGVTVLAKEPDVMIIPAHLEWKKHKLIRTYQIGFGKPFDGSKLTAEEIMARVYAVPLA